MTRESIQFACKEMWNRQVTTLCSGYPLPRRTLAYVQAYLLWCLKAISLKCFDICRIT